MPEENDAGSYDIISDPAKRLAHEGGFLLWLLSIAPGKRVLDMAAATGVHARFLAENGAEVTARDIDSDSIEYARTHRAYPRITWQVQDLREPLDGPFDLVIVMGNTLCLLDTLEDVKKGLAAAARMVAPGGVFFAHVVNYAGLEAAGPRQKVARLASEGIDRIIVKDMVPTGGGGPALVAFSHFELEDGVWRTWGSQSVLLNLRKDTLERLIERAGLRVEGVYGDYDRSPFDENTSPDLLFVARKPDES